MGWRVREGETLSRDFMNNVCRTLEVEKGGGMCISFRLWFIRITVSLFSEQKR